ncbi:MAG: RNA polymerase sigma factor [Polyangiales bacterium]
MAPLEPSDDRALVEALRRGDASAFDVAYERYRARIFAFLLRLSRRREVADELSQETWMKLARHREKLREDTDLRAWLYSVARNAWVSYRRWSVLDISRFVALDDVHEWAPSEGLSPEAQTDARRSMVRLERALGRVPASAREALLLVGAEGFDQDHAADILGLRPDAFRQRLSRARARLAEELAKLDSPVQSRGAHADADR